MSYYNINSNKIYNSYVDIQNSIKQKHNASVQIEIDQFIKDNNLVKLKCDYLGMTSFYYDYIKTIMYSYTHGDDEMKISNDVHILELNDLL